jgi:TPP-dependent pyruvate/acetoin dehydrogenase alpha subunit
MKHYSYPPNGPEMFETMLRIRAVEDRLQTYCDRGLAGDLHFSKGQEAIAVGVMAALRSSDLFVTHHRTIAHEIARGAELYPLVAEILGKKTGLNRGRAGEMHLHNLAVGHAFSFQLVGTVVPVGAGLAWYRRYVAQTDDVVVVFLGDAAFSNGVVHEGLNVAYVQSVPLVVIVENNHLAGNIAPPHYQTHCSWAERLAPYSGSTVDRVDATDPERVCEAASAAVDEARRLGGPTFLVCDAPRLCWHKQGQRDVRLPTEIAREARFDPLLVMQRRLGLAHGKIAYQRVKIEKELDEVFARVEADPPAEMHYDD